MPSSIHLATDEFRLLTYKHPQLTQRGIQPRYLQKFCPLDNDQLRTDSMKIPASISNIGSLEALPLEVLQSILSLLDLQCLTDFRAVSWRSRALVDSVPEYNALVQHCPDALRAFLSTGMAVDFSASKIFEALCTRDCIGCGLFGPLLDLFTAHRCCIGCLMSRDDLLTMEASDASKEFSLDLETMHKVPNLLTIPEYNRDGMIVQERLSLVRVLSVSVAQSQHDFRSVHNTPPLPPTGAPPQPSQPHSLPVSHQLQQRHEGKQHLYRSLSMLRIPFLERRTGDLDWGVSCEACRLGPKNGGHGYYDSKNLYTTSGYIDHFQKCELSQKARAEISKCFHLGKRDHEVWSMLVDFFSNFNY
ncbi:Cyclin-like F-box protein [Rutstroemia sp. NJR-2017a BVV2]|nr:Cyclin-like F-box protein [Rutstroemia sp. NJR-2017a BVV2]